VSHAKLCSPSKADGWFACAGRSVMESAFPDKGNEYSADGSARHEIVALCLKSTDNCIQHVGRMIDVDGTAIRYDEDWVAEDQDYVATVRGRWQAATASCSSSAGQLRALHRREGRQFRHRRRDRVQAAGG
jgi:hypothetical protein